MTQVYSTSPTAKADLLSYHLYLWEGLVIFVANILLFIVIIKNASNHIAYCLIEFSSKLRCQKEYLLYAGCMAFDIVFGLTYFIAAVYRFLLFWNNKYFPLYTMYECLTTPHIILFVFITPGAGVLVFVCSIDRLIGVFFPIKYIKLSTNYVLILFAISFTIPILMLIASLITSAPNDTIHNQLATCTTTQGTTEDMYMVLRLTRIVGSCSCAVIYIPIFIKIFMNVHAMSKSQVSSSRTKKLLRTTTTVVLITLNTILMFSFPDIILIINPKTTSNFFYVLNLNKGVLNLIIFAVTQHTLRQAVLDFILRRKIKRKITTSRVSAVPQKTTIFTVKSTA